jgi:hypothetical protein
MKTKLYFFGIVTAILLSSCSDQERLAHVNKIHVLEGKVFTQPTAGGNVPFPAANSKITSNSQGFNPAVAGELIKSYMDYAEKYPEDTMAPGCIYKAAELQRTLRQGQEAFDSYGKIIEKYSNYELIPMCYFFRAFVMDDIMNNDAKAKELYREFINKYPNHKFAETANAYFLPGKNRRRTDKNV